MGKLIWQYSRVLSVEHHPNFVPPHRDSFWNQILALSDTECKSRINKKRVSKNESLQEHEVRRADRHSSSFWSSTSSFSNRQPRPASAAPARGHGRLWGGLSPSSSPTCGLWGRGSRGGSLQRSLRRRRPPLGPQGLFRERLVTSFYVSSGEEKKRL